jgi:transposase
MPAPLSLEIRSTIQELLECGITHEAIADDLSISRPAVSSLSRHIKKHGHIFPVKPPGNTPTLNDKDYPIIKRIVEEKPDLTLKDYAQEISEQTGKSLLSTPTICRVLKKLNLRLKKKSKYAEERDRSDIKKKI